MSTKPVHFNCTVLRDGHQSLAATRMTTQQMLPALDMLDGLGYHTLETWGGATIDAGLRFLDEFPFDRLDAIREKTKTQHMMLLRGQNIVAYSQMPDDVVRSFCTQAANHGMNILRIFDCLNDTRNLQTAIEATKAAGAHAQGTICYTKSPVHTVEGFIKLGCELAEMGCASVVLKDMAGLVPPAIAAEIIAGLKQNLPKNIPVWVHTHDTAGIGASTYLAAIEAGADAVDVSIMPFANGTSQPDTQRMLALMHGHARKPEFDTNVLMDLRRHFDSVYKELSQYTSHGNEVIDADAMTFEVPGGMLSNFRTQLKELNMEDKFAEVFAEIPVVREALGWIPLVTPTSQIVGSQAVMNVKFGRWKNFTPAARDIALGYFGRTPAPVNKEVQKLAQQAWEKDGVDKAPITQRPADLLKPDMDNLRSKLKEKDLPTNDEHCVIYKMFPQQLEKHLNNKAAKAKEAEAAAARTHQPTKLNLTINGTQHNVVVEEVA